ncbi:MAG: NADH-quinone oxidoreductase subunit NuoF [Gemmatimonadetes bacterium]|uniref:NADH-quinone oxidoreductase subunit F n=1 Tax=Candidatus Kutchimonas denitrificans TaxID=3056748 RepID=A0AAE5C976_9BACT|nr:NADH-quinone oxidoreductase subunit NuoF [Gemmatimonadota bacterium]NIR75211.1 NADH-quinone oxidoreductase subunit NuoF [Candidatus Kutchimonas denitrificans]NIS00149.1 NADH-quinone oxidoreductase subunit NuoF [Gemmatimonadota bacterium]NIT65741.1 NADH-quinone oxidoreductase subunit NuoF [Gemmatimonadota bacterium]NIU53019.1 NADH-quinone oxidoreductase subunit NuoF [Gemmatimonadota bacterium]
MAYPHAHPREVRLLSKYFGDEDAIGIEGWAERGGYVALEKALEMGPDEVTEVVKESGLRGRGGAGFPAGLKWSFMPKDGKRPNYLACNADESEPGTFKDREIMRWTPHQMIEGIIICSYAIRAQHAYIYIRGEMVDVVRVVNDAVVEAYRKGYLGENILGSGYDLELTVHLGAGAYIAGEETGLLSSLEGRRAEPKVKPPFPAQRGAFGMPTTVNNVETLAAVPHIVENGADWYRQWGTEKSPGTKLFSCCGHLQRPGNYEVSLDFNLKELVYDLCGGPPEGRQLRAVIPGGSSVPLMTVDEIDCDVSYEGIEAAGSLQGSGGLIAIDDSACLLRSIRKMVDFYAHESCGQCTNCREGTVWLANILRRIERGDGREEDLPLLLDVGANMAGRTICPLSDSAAVPVVSGIQKFEEEFVAHIKDGTCTAVR